MHFTTIHNTQWTQPLLQYIPISFFSNNKKNTKFAESMTTILFSTKYYHPELREIILLLKLRTAENVYSRNTGWKERQKYERKLLNDN